MTAEDEEANEDGSDMNLYDFILFTYNILLKGGWRMKEIDGMDMLGFLKIRAWNAKKEKKAPRQRYIDEVWPDMKPG